MTPEIPEPTNVGPPTHLPTADFPTVLKRIKLLGFNAIRLPFTFRDLDRTPNNRIYVVNCKVMD